MITTNPKRNGCGSEILDALPPHDLEAERQVLATFLFEPKWREPLLERVDTPDFYVDANAKLFAHMKRIEELNELLLVRSLKAAGQFDHEHFLSTFKASNTTIYPEQAAEIVREKSLRRQLRHVGTLLVRDSARDTEDIDLLLERATELLRPAQRSSGGEPVTISAAEIEPKQLTWLWPDRFPMGKLSLLVGVPDVGKSILTYAIASSVTNGWLWPDRSGMAPQGGVILLDCEDDAEDTVVPRLMAASADLAQVRIVKSSRLKDGSGRFFDLRFDLDKLRQAIHETPGAKLIIISPLGAFMGDTNSHKDAEVRSALAPLSALAAETGIAIIAIMHLNKGNGQKAIHRITGSGAFVAAARACWLIARDPEDEGRRLVVRVKANLAKDPTGLAYRIQDYCGQPQIQWEDGEVRESADDVLGSGSKDTEQERAKKWLIDSFPVGEFVLTADLQAQSAAAGMSWWTVKKVLGAAGMASAKEDGKRGRWGYRRVELSKQSKVAHFAEFTQFAQLPDQGTDPEQPEE